MKRSILMSVTMLAIMLLTAFSASAQSPVHWTASCKMTTKTEGVITIVGKIDKGWHVYGLNQPEDGPVPTSVKFAATKGVKFKGAPKYSPAPVTVMDEMFGAKVAYWENKVVFTQKFTVSKVKTATATITVNYMACNDSSCRPPSTETIKVKIK